MAVQKWMVFIDHYEGGERVSQSEAYDPYTGQDIVFDTEEEGKEYVAEHRLEDEFKICHVSLTNVGETQGINYKVIKARDTREIGRLLGPHIFPLSSIDADRAEYAGLCAAFPLRPIKDEAGLTTAIGIIDRLIDKDALSFAEDDYLDVLSDLVVKYEDKMYPDEPFKNDGEAIQALLDNGFTQAEFARKTKIPESTISEILRGKRRLNRNQLRRICEAFKINPTFFTL